MIEICKQVAIYNVYENKERVEERESIKSIFRRKCFSIFYCNYHLHGCTCVPTPYLLHHLQISYTSVYYIWLWNLCIFLCISFILLKNNVTNKGLSKNLPILNVYWSRKEYWLTVSFWVGDHERQMQVIAKFQSLRARQMNFSELWQPRHSSSIFNGVSINKPYKIFT